MSYPVELSQRECLDLLADQSVGRVAFDTPAGPQIFPVNFFLSEDHVVFRTASYNELGRVVLDTKVAFEVDELDHDARAGWSVVVTGKATLLDISKVGRIRAARALEPWASGPRSMFVQIEPRQMSGRRVAADPD